jgi:L-malate glycosyltransferase
MQSDNVTVLHVNDSRSWRGGERQTLLLAVAVQQVGVTSIVAAPRGSALYAEAEAAGLRVLPLTVHGEWDIAAATAIRRAVRRMAVDIVHAHTSHAHGVSALALLGGGRTALMVTRRVDYPMRCNPLNRLKYDRCDRFVAVSEKIVQNLVAGGIPQRRIARIYDGIDRAKFDRPALVGLKATLALPEATCGIGTVAALTREKGLDILLQAAHQVLQRHPHVCFVVVGGGTQADPLRDLTRALDIEERVVFTGERPDAEHLIPLFDIFVLPSRREGLGSSLLDAMAAGVPIVAARTGGVPELVEDDVSGLLFPPGDADALASHIGTLVEDESMRARLAAGGRERVGRFDISSIAEQTWQVYRTVRNEKSPRRSHRSSTRK